MDTLTKQAGVKVERGQLKNGAPVLTFNRKGMPVHVSALFYSGSRFDGGKDGLAHFLEHMLVAGSEKFPSKNLLAKHIEQLGGEFSATTNPDWLRFNIEVAEKTDLEAGIGILREILCHPLFEEKTTETERGSIYSEILSTKSNPREYVWSSYRKLFFKGTDVGHNVTGSVETVADITLEDIKSHYKNFIVSGRLFYIVSGDVEGSEIIPLLEKGIVIPYSPRVTNSDKMPIVREQSISVEKYETEQDQMIFGFRVDTDNLDQLAALGLISTISGGGRATRLTEELRYKRGLVYSINSRMFSYNGGGVWLINTDNHSSKRREVLEIIAQEIRNIKKGKLGQDDLNFAKGKIPKSTIRQLQMSKAWIDIQQSYLSIDLDNIITVDDYIERISNITVEDLQAVANKYFTDDNWYTSICGKDDGETISIAF